jgi:adenylate kinase family enzyme
MIHLIVGSTGAGKTTYAQKLKKENQGILFSIDQ